MITVCPADLPAELRRIRQEQGLTMKQLCKRTYETEPNISYRERNITRTTLDTLQRWAAGLGYDVAIVLTEVQE